MKRIGILAMLVFLLVLPTIINSVSALSNKQMRELPPKYGGKLIVSINTDPAHLNPAITTSYFIDVVTGQIYNSLMEYDWRTLEPIPELARSWEISDDGLTYTFHLVENATWHDGVPFTSADVKFTFEQITIPYHPRGNRTFGFIDFETPDDHTVVMHLEHPYAPLINFFTLWYVGIMPKHIYEGTDILDNPHNWEDPIGTGPFILKEWVKGSHISLVRNPNYWQKGKPYLDEVIYRIIPDSSQRLLAFENKEVDYVPIMLPLSELDRLNNTDGINVVFCGAFGSMHTIQNNLQHPILSNKKVRQAIAHAVDKELMNELVNYNLLRVATGPLPSTSWAYNPNVNKYEYDPELAEKLLEEAGYPRGSDGNRFKLELIVGPTGRDKGLPEMEIMRSQLKEVGIVLDLKVYDEATSTDLVYIKHDFDMFLIAGLSTAPDPNMISGYLHSSRILLDNPIPGLWNVMVYNNSRIDELFNSGILETDFEKRKEIYGELQEILVEDLPCYWLIEDRYAHFYWEDFVGIPAGPYGGARERLDDVWWTEGSEISPETAAASIEDAEVKLDELEKKKYDVTEARDKLEEAKEALANYDYVSTQRLANEALGLAKKPRPPYEMYAVGVVVVIVVIAAIILFMRR